MCGPNAPLSHAFIFCGWRTLQVDWKLDPAHDLSDSRRQASLAEQLSDCAFIAAALDCTTKSRAREIPRVFDDGRRAPPPLRSDRFPEGLPNLCPTDQARVDTDNKACAWILSQLQHAAEEGRGALRENPARSLHWELPQEKDMWESGLWYDTDYSACVFASARAKSQKLRHNIPEIQEWGPLQCHHVHASDEWTPWQEDGVPVYPSSEEAEYSACLAFSIAVSVSWWAARMGYAVVDIPRLPPVECVGRLLEFDPRSMRKWAMSPLAISLGLLPLDANEAARVPLRGRVADFLTDGQLHPGCIYVGQGHHRHRLKRTKWASPFVPGHDVSMDEWLPAYVNWVSQTLLADLKELEGQRLVCDCEHGGPCEADILAGLVFDSLRPDEPPPCSI